MNRNFKAIIINSSIFAITNIVMLFGAIILIDAATKTYYLNNPASDNGLASLGITAVHTVLSTIISAIVSVIILTFVNLNILKLIIKKRFVIGILIPNIIFFFGLLGYLIIRDFNSIMFSMDYLKINFSSSAFFCTLNLVVSILTFIIIESLRFIIKKLILRNRK